HFFCQNSAASSDALLACSIDAVGFYTYGAAFSSMTPDDYDPIAAALKEDIGKGDITTEFFVPETLHASGRIVAHEPAVIAGTGTAVEIFRKIDPAHDGPIVRAGAEAVDAGDIVIEVRGVARSILKA